MPAQQQPVVIGTDCSGMEAPVMALRNLGVPLDHAFSCDINRHAKETIMANCKPRVWYDDLTTRDNHKAPKADLYVAGFPCQPFSAAGKQQGFNDEKGRGTIFFELREYIRLKEPRAFVLENVERLKHLEGGQYFQDIMDSLEALGKYNVQAQVMDTKQHGIPQSRPRIYFVGIKKSVDQGTFEFPEPVGCAAVEDLLEPRKRRPDPRTDLPPKKSRGSRANVQLALKQLQAKGHDPLRECWFIDCDSSANRMNIMNNYSPCMIRSRYYGFWLSNRGRRATKAEMMALQGMKMAGFKVVVSDNQMGMLIGNSMSVNVLERLFVRLLPAAGLVAADSVRDRWATKASMARAVRSLSAANASSSGAPSKRAAAAANQATAKRARQG